MSLFSCVMAYDPQLVYNAKLRNFCDMRSTLSLIDKIAVPLPSRKLRNQKEELPLKGDTVIDNDVWIGQHVTVMPGVHIGDGAIIGANSVVASDIPPYSIAVGNPCRVVKKRFDDELIDLLLQFKWWDKDIEEIESLMPLLSCSDLDKVKAELMERL